MHEGQPKSDLVKVARALLSGFVIFRLEDYSTNGIPDIAVTGLRRTSWWEVKLANPSFKAKGIQTLTMTRLAASGIAYYIVYAMSGGQRSVRIIHPRDIGHWRDAGEMREGFDHRWVAERILHEHANL